MKNEIIGPVRLDLLMKLEEPVRGPSDQKDPTERVGYTDPTERYTDLTERMGVLDSKVRRLPRIAAVVVPAFPVALLVREKPQYANRAVVVADGEEESSEVIACNTKAAGYGIENGMTVAQARVRSDNLVVGIRAEQSELEQSSRLINLFQKLTPFVEEDAPGRWYLDVAGLMLLYKTETEFARRVIAAVAEGGLQAQVGIAGNKYVAAVAAETAGEQTGQAIVIVPDRAEQAFLTDLPIAYLPVTDNTREKLILLGIRTIGQVAGFKGNELIERFGEDGYLLAELSHGDDRAAFLPKLPEEELAVEQHLLFALSTRQALTAQLERLLQQLFNRLKPVSRGCGCLAITVTDESRGEHTVEIAVESPTLQLKPFIRQIIPALEKLRVRSGIKHIKITVPRMQLLLPEQLSLPTSVSGNSQALGGRQLDPNRVNDYRQIYRYRPRYSALPEQSFELVSLEEKFTVKPPEAVGANTRKAYARPGLNGLRLLQPPKQITVTFDSDRLQAVVMHGKRQVVRTVHGPWEISGNWWQTPFVRSYYEIELQNGCRYLVFSRPTGGIEQTSLFDSPDNVWFVQGVFD